MKKLSDDAVAEIRRLSMTGLSNKELAFRFGVAVPTVNRILNGKRRALHSSDSDSSSVAFDSENLDARLGYRNT
jgi:hypothetical protein